MVLSGDTRYSENLIRNAQGVDVLVHEVVFGAANAEQQHYECTHHAGASRAGVRSDEAKAGHKS